MRGIAGKWTRKVRGAPMFRGRLNLIVTALVGTSFIYFAYRFVSWAVFKAIWTIPAGADSSLCRAAKGEGACWAVITERFRFVLLGSYPFHEQWRPVLVCLLFVLLYVVSGMRTCWKPWLVILWIAVPSVATLLLRGGVLGLTSVPTEFWGGLPLTFVLSTVGFASAFPVAIGLALCRRSQMPIIRMLSIAYIEIIRGVPIITFLFMAAVMFPLFMPQSFTLDKLLRAQIAFVMVIAAYLAEVIRAGLQAIPHGQHEAAASMGLSFWPATILVILPQALRVTIPALVNTFIAFFKDTSLIIVIGLFDLLGAAKVIIVDPKWFGFGTEVYLFVAAVYFLFCFAVSQYSQRLEKNLIRQSHN